jgi:F-type H+-transporting ATPase subunit delta
MAENKVAKKYATALFRVACQTGIESVVWEDLAAINEALQKERRFLSFLASPQLSLEEKKGLVRALVGDKGQVAVRSFLLFLIDKGRTGLLERMIEIYRELLDAHEGVLDTLITSAVPLTPEEEKSLVQKLETMSGQRLRYRLEVDAEILGGVIVIMGGQIIDHSVRHDLSRLRDALRALKVHDAAA